MSEVLRICVECGCWVPKSAGKAQVCSDECRDARLKTRQTSIAARFVSLQRILRDEKIYWRDDRLIHSENFYAALIESGCTYCGTSLLRYAGVCLDRILSDSKHNSWSVCPACPLCNRCKSSEGEAGFSFEEMAQEIGPAIARVRARRAQNNN